MSGGFKFPIGGMVSSLTRLGDAIGGNSETAMQEACVHLEAEIKARAPVDTGHLKSSYRSIVESGSGDTVVGHVGTNVDYSVPQEFGTQHQPGTPHVRPAIDASRPDLLDILGDQTVGAAVRSI